MRCRISPLIHSSSMNHLYSLLSLCLRAEGENLTFVWCLLLHSNHLPDWPLEQVFQVDYKLLDDLLCPVHLNTGLKSQVRKWPHPRLFCLQEAATNIGHKVLKQPKWKLLYPVTSKNGGFLCTKTNDFHKDHKINFYGGCKLVSCPMKALI